MHLNIEYRCPKLKSALYKTKFLTPLIIVRMNKDNPSEIKNDIFQELEREIEKLFEELPQENLIQFEEKDPISQLAKQRCLRETVNDIFKTLTAREERLMRMYFGFGLNHSFKIYEIARQFDLSQADIRQQLTTAFRRFLNKLFMEMN